MIKYIIGLLEDTEEEFYHKIEKRNEQIKELQETIKKQGLIIDKLKIEMKK